MKNINLFSTQSDYESATLTYPNLSFVTEEDYKKVYTGLFPPTEFVDLGLSDSTEWAKYNIGATSETDKGLFFQWGTSLGYADEQALNHSTWLTCPGNGGYSSYNETSMSAYDEMWVYNDTSDRLSDIGVPRSKHVKILIEQTTQEYVQINGVYGVKFINKKDTSKYIFFPCTGEIYDGKLQFDNLSFIWLNERNTSDHSKARALQISEDEYVFDDDSYRYYALPIRQIHIQLN